MKFPSANKQDGFVLHIQFDLCSYRSTQQRQVIDASWPLWFIQRETSSRPWCWQNLFTNDETIKIGSHISSQRLFLGEKLRRSSGDGWGFKVTAVVYDRYWMDCILNKCPHQSCLCSKARSSTPTTPLSFSLCRRWMCVCVAYDRVMCPSMLVGFISRN